MFLIDAQKMCQLNAIVKGVQPLNVKGVLNSEKLKFTTLSWANLHYYFQNKKMTP